METLEEKQARLEKLTIDELNAEVGIHVYKMPQYLHRSGLRVVYRPDPQREHLRTPAKGDEPLYENYYVGGLPDYSTTHGLMALVEHMRNEWDNPESGEGFYWQWVDCMKHNGWRVDVMFGHHDGDALHCSVTDKDLGRAIIIAALLMV